MELKEAQEKLSPKKYNELLQYLELKDLYLKESRCELHSRNLDDNASIEFREKAGKVNLVENTASIEIAYDLNVHSKESKILTISAKYVIIYEVAQKLPEEFFEIYTNFTLPIQTFPYLRELVHSTTTKMGLPHLLLPLRKYLIAGSKR